MPVNKVRRLGSFAPLSAQAWTDDALAEAGEGAELLYYRALSFSAYVLRDGLITDSQLVRMVGHGMRDAKKRADRLCAVGLWTRVDGGYRVRTWLKWNRSYEEITGLQRKDADRKGSPRTPPDNPPSGEGQPDGSESERNPIGVQTDSESDTAEHRNGFPPRARTPYPTPDPHTEPKPTTPAPVGAETFARFWGVYPKRVGKKDAERKWDKALKDGVDPELLIEAARRYAAAREGQDPKFTVHPATWLHQGRWDDDQPSLRLVSGGYQPWRNPTDPADYDEDLLP